jgi:phosphate starvation-inducible protein PhoH
MERKLELKRGRALPLLFGIQDANLHYLEEQLRVHITLDDATVIIHGEPEATRLAKRLLESAYGLLESGVTLDMADFGFLLRLLESGEDLTPQAV